MKHTTEPPSPLFNPQDVPRLPRAANVDPATSHEAARKIAEHADKQAEVVAEAVIANPGHTSAELASMHGLDRHMVARRLPEAERAGWVRRGAAKVCSVTGHKALTWTSETRDAR